MPELPEVEVVRRGLAEHITGRTVRDVRVLHPRAVRDHVGSIHDALVGHTFGEPDRRGKFLWVPLQDTLASNSPQALFVHLGMSGQMLVNPTNNPPDSRHIRVQADLDHNLTLSFVDQRTFGKWAVVPMDFHRGPTGGRMLPLPVAHIAPDPFEDLFDVRWASKAIKNKHSEIKRVLLDQTVVSGIGNIYADEALFRAKVRPRRSAHLLSRVSIERILMSAKEVMGQALAVGGTSFDSLYVNVNGESGYFDRSLLAYGRGGQPCTVCGTTMKKIVVGGRGTHFCPSCQK